MSPFVPPLEANDIITAESPNPVVFAWELIRPIFAIFLVAALFVSLRFGLDAFFLIRKIATTFAGLMAVGLVFGSLLTYKISTTEYTKTITIARREYTVSRQYVKDVRQIVIFDYNIGYSTVQMQERGDECPLTTKNSLWALVTTFQPRSGFLGVKSNGRIVSHLRNLAA